MRGGRQEYIAECNLLNSLTSRSRLTLRGLAYSMIESLFASIFVLASNQTITSALYLGYYGSMPIERGDIQRTSVHEARALFQSAKDESGYVMCRNVCCLTFKFIYSYLALWRTLGISLFRRASTRASCVCRYTTTSRNAANPIVAANCIGALPLSIISLSFQAAIDADPMSPAFD